MPGSDADPKRRRPNCEVKRRHPCASFAVGCGGQWGWPAHLEFAGPPLAPAFIAFGMTGCLEGDQAVDIDRSVDCECRHPQCTGIQRRARSEAAQAGQSIRIVGYLDDLRSRDGAVRPIDDEPERCRIRTQQIRHISATVRRLASRYFSEATIRA